MTSSYHWAIQPDNTLRITWSTGSVNMGTVQDVLALWDVEPDRMFSCRPWWPSLGTAEKGDLHRTREEDILALVAAATKLRIDAQSAWRVCALNLCIHPFYGPGHVIATDGVKAILWSKPSLEAEHAVVFRSNLVGPVTSIPFDPSEWDYVNNVPAKKTSTPSLKSRVEAYVAEQLAKLIGTSPQ